MKNISSFSVAVFCLALVLGCDLAKSVTGPTATPYVSQADSFSVTFPAGSKETAVGDDSSAYGDNKVTLYSTTHEAVGYRVKVILRGGYSDEFIHKMTVHEVNNTVSEIVFPWQDDGTTEIKGTPQDAPRKDTTFKGYPAIEASGVSNELSAVGMMFKRQVLVWVAPLKKAYVIETFSKKKEDLTSKQTNEFFDSFKIEQAAK